jgi:hypothetical protein
VVVVIVIVLVVVVLIVVVVVVTVLVISVVVVVVVIPVVVVVAGVGVGVVSGFFIRPAQEKRFRPEAVVGGKTVWGCQGVFDKVLIGNDNHNMRALLARSCSPPRGLSEDRGGGCGCC